MSKINWYWPFPLATIGLNLGREPLLPKGQVGRNPHKPAWKKGEAHIWSLGPWTWSPHTCTWHMHLLFGDVDFSTFILGCVLGLSPSLENCLCCLLSTLFCFFLFLSLPSYRPWNKSVFTSLSLPEISFCERRQPTWKAWVRSRIDSLFLQRAIHHSRLRSWLPPKIRWQGSTPMPDRPSGCQVWLDGHLVGLVGLEVWVMLGLTADFIGPRSPNHFQVPKVKAADFLLGLPLLTSLLHMTHLVTSSRVNSFHISEDPFGMENSFERSQIKAGIP